MVQCEFNEMEEIKALLSQWSMQSYGDDANACIFIYNDVTFCVGVDSSKIVILSNEVYRVDLADSDRVATVKNMIMSSNQIHGDACLFYRIDNENDQMIVSVRNEAFKVYDLENFRREFRFLCIHTMNPVANFLNEVQNQLNSESK